MNNRTPHRILGLVSLIAVVAGTSVLGGCTGPTKRGKEARALANTKFNVVRSRVDYDQADQAFRAGNFLEAKRHLEAAIDKYDGESAYWVLLEIGRAHV